MTATSSSVAAATTPAPTAVHTYAVITPARNEAENLPRLAASLAAQTILPTEWIVAENGSTDDTRAVVEVFAAAHPWARLLELEGAGRPVRGAPIVRAIHAGVAALETSPDVVVNVDADVSVDPDYFERLLQLFEASPALGIASGTAVEQDADGVWRPRFVTGDNVWGATRAYRMACLRDVLPLEERHGWDGIDQLKARSRGWTTRLLVDLTFRHHRPEGSRDGSGWRHWFAAGETCHYMGYRPAYLVARAVHQARRDRSAVGLLAGYASSAIRRTARWPDEGGRRLLREDQSLRLLARRRREAHGVRQETRAT